MSVTVKDRGWNRIRKEIEEMGRSFVKIGVLSNAGRYPASQGNMNLAEVATAHEFGTEKIPERPFMRQAFDTSNRKISDFIKKERDKIYRGESSTNESLHKLGVLHQGQVQETITTGEFKPLAPSTIKRKGSSKPLIDTGRLRQSINFEVTRE